MRLHIANRPTVGHISYYLIVPHSERSLGDKEKNHFRAFAPRIENMACRELGEHFVSFRQITDRSMLLGVKVRTSQHKPFELRRLFGWIELFDSENEQAEEADAQETSG